MKLPGIDYEKQYWLDNKIIAGIDEAGRGCLAGPVVSAAVILKPNTLLDTGINDSKQLTPEKREELFDVIIENALAYSISVIDNKVIDQINIFQAAMLSMKKAATGLEIKPHHLLIDGNKDCGAGIESTTIISGDAISLSIASASILAKVFRDGIMKNQAHEEFPQYNFASHKGYATKKHFEALDQFGTCKLHRMTFLRKYFNRQISIF